MRKLLSFLLLLPVIVTGQSYNQNFIKTKIYKDSTEIMGSNPIGIRSANTISYFDGLGRPIQQVFYGMATTGHNIVQPIAYDSLGRQSRSYLPFVSPMNASFDFDASGTGGSMDYYSEIPNPLNTSNPSLERTGNPYTETLFEPSPLNRVLEQGAPGNTWAANPGSDADHTVKYDYQLNTAVNTSDKVKFFKAAATWNATLGYYGATLTNAAGTTYYEAGKLTRSIMKDENWTAGKNNTVEEYRNSEGQLVLKRAFNEAGAVPYDTYYVYDQFGNLSFVLPPLATGSITSVVLDGLCYQYRYDDRNRTVEKKLPGKQWQFIVYDVLGRVVATGPSLSPFADISGYGWLVSKYDAFNRPVLTGWVAVGTSISSTQRQALQLARDAQLTNLNETRKLATTTVNGISFNYSTVAYPDSRYHVLTVNYYDDYSYVSGPTDFTTQIQGQKVYYNNSTRKPKGMPTGTWIRIVENSTLYRYELGWSLYDSNARPISTKMLNHLGGYTQVDSKLTFSGRTDYTVTTHKRLSSSAELYIKDNFTYNEQDLLVKHTHQIGTAGTPQLLAYNTYDEMGQLMNRKTGGTDLTAATYFQKTDYTFTVRGWLKSINDITNLADGSLRDFFAFKINYQTTEGTAVTNVVPLYNGNISETYWRTSADNVLRKYAYQYDKINRLEKATYVKPGASPSEIWNSYDEQITYNRNGNILQLYRNGGLDSPDEQVIDNLKFIYEVFSNKLLKVTDNEANTQGFKDDVTDPLLDTDTDYKYDNNGNMTADQNKKILNITYNHLNLPVLITFGMTGTNTIEYLYDAVGTRLGKKIVMYNTSSGAQSTTQTDYLGGFQYAQGVLQFFPTAQGYVKVTGSTNNYVFNFTDHLGNVRLSYTQDPANGILKIVEENHYYPYGLKHQNYNIDKLEYVPADTGVVLASASALQYKYKFNGQEFQEELGLNMTAMDFRQYDNAIGRFVGMDALSEMGYSVTPYHFGFDNPVYFGDPSGLKAAPKWLEGSGLTDDTQNDYLSSSNPDWALAMWSSTGAGVNSIWNNDGSGNFDNENGSGFVNASGEYYANPESLPELTIYSKKGGGFVGNIGGQMQSQVYWNSKYYKSFRDGQLSGQIDDMQSILDGIGVIDPTGLVDGLNSLGYLARGQKANAAIAAIGIIPYIGDLGKAGKVSHALLSSSEILRIENAATRIGKPITVVGSRASGTAHALSDWDYVIEGINSKTWSKIKNSLPGAASSMDNMAKNIDLFTTEINKTLPYITILPK